MTRCLSIPRLLPLLAVLSTGCPRHHHTDDADVDRDGSVPPDGDRPECLLAEGVRSPKEGCPECPEGESVLLVEELDFLPICSGDTDHPMHSTLVLRGMCHGPDVMLDARNPLDQPSCVSPAVCRWWHDGDLSDPLRCTYADTSQMVTGAIPPLDSATCEAARGQGGCGVDCECMEQEDVCYGISEVHPLGACVPYYAPLCGSGAACPDQRCLRPVALPTFDEAYWVRELGDDPVAGRCVAEETCALVRDQDPESYECL